MSEVMYTSVSLLTTDVTFVSDQRNPLAIYGDILPDSNESDTSNSLITGVANTNNPDAANANEILCIKLIDIS